MVLGLLAGAAAAGAGTLFFYNRGNFLFDQKLRQEQEFNILEFRSAQAEQWREDVRELMDMTERKMDSYTVVAVLMLDICVGMFAEGRLQPSTPPWFLHFYMLALGGAFLYLTMSMWFAMGAQVAANCSSVRLLTQLVRLPIPSWEQLEDVRRYASAFEDLRGPRQVRVPFTGRAARVAPLRPGGGGRGSAPAPAPAAADPWALERHGRRRGLEELEAVHPALRRHVALARGALRRFQAQDATARLSLSFGVQQLLGAVAYYCIGYATLQDGAVWSAWCVLAVAAAAAAALLVVDFSPSRGERALALALSLTGPLCCAGAATATALRGDKSHGLLMVLLPVACASHGLWLLWALSACGFERQPSGAVLPTRFRAVLYLDVFGWLRRPERGARAERGPPGAEGVSAAARRDGAEEPAARGVLPESPREALPQLQRELRADAAAWQAERCERPADGEEAARVRSLTERVSRVLDEQLHCMDAGTSAARRGPAASGRGARAARGARPPASTRHNSDEERGYDYSPVLTNSDEEAADRPWDLAASSSSGLRCTKAVRWASREAFSPETYFLADPGSRRRSSGGCGGAAAAGGDEGQSGCLPARVFRWATVMLVLQWSVGLVLPFGSVMEFMAEPIMAGVRVEGGGARAARLRPPRPSWPVLTQRSPERLQLLSDGELVQVRWPRRAAFFPHALSTDDRGGLAVADDIGIYLAGFTGPSRRGRGRGASPWRAAAFHRVALCSASGGPALSTAQLTDMSLACAPGAAEAPCRLFALTEGGRRIVECPLPAGLGANRSGEGPGPSWSVGGDWLHRERGERIESLAVDGGCFRAAGPQATAVPAFDAAGLGCVVVGTSLGRIVQLRGRLGGGGVLVPERSLHQGGAAVARGSLHVLPGGVVAALRQRPGRRSKHAVLQAFGPRDGELVGEWRLPRGPDWLAFSGSGDALLALGLRDRRRMGLFSFPVPAELRAL